MIIKENEAIMAEVVSDEGRQRDLLMDDEEEDFLDECIVNPTGKGCPTVLLLCASTLLSEITAYMRETYRSVPKQTKVMRHMKTISESSGGVAVVGARRWSTVTQSM